ncbi:DUF3179 domain-containing (seleno)protein [Haloferax marisrubri]|uniref:DUF3179 domain-containing protein n=1 Tax=Haloferax marisrubri TaxID=1544719 RepID=A0A2P4NQE8_9EURY|nr:DUF3179 domain-containing (seleno)protein [Haloferax marisrubri]POG55372.1 DUF3179 domain-containing protein [Haloferax marisrubri]
MYRRTFLGLVSAATAGLAGCTEGSVRPPRAGFPPPENPDPVVAQGFPRTVCSAPPSPVDGVHAIVDPAVDSGWAGRRVDAKYRFGDDPEPGLYDGTYVVGVERGGATRAYPLSVLWWHEVVNDSLGGDPLFVSYCPMCQSGLVAERVVNGAPTTFLVSGQLWQPPATRGFTSAAEGRVFGASVLTGDAELRNAANLVLYDEATGSYWSQLLATGICGPQSGEELAVLPSSVTTWAEWRADHPDTDVLLPPPWSKTT